MPAAEHIHLMGIGGTGMTALAGLLHQAGCRVTGSDRRLYPPTSLILAEMGLLTRPLHLWVGHSIVTDCLSPYPRDLRELMQRWLRLSPDAVGADLRGDSSTFGEDAVYALCHDFLRTDPQLGEERAMAERSVGLTRYRFETQSYEIIDLGRIDPNACDARLMGLGNLAPGSVMLRLGTSPEDSGAGAIRTLMRELGPILQSVTFVMEGSPIGLSEGAVVHPQGLVCWAGEERLSLNARAGFGAEALQGYAEAQGFVLSTPSAALLSSERLSQMRRSLPLVGVNVGGEGVLRAINEALWNGQLDGSKDVNWVFVGSQHGETGRPTLASLAGLSAVAVAHLRSLGGPPQAPTVQEPAQPEPRRPSRSAIRIKA